DRDAFSHLGGLSSDGDGYKFIPWDSRRLPIANQDFNRRAARTANSVDGYAKRTLADRNGSRGQLARRRGSGCANSHDGEQKSRKDERTLHMKLARLFILSSAVALAPAALAQRWEFGGGLGGSFYTSRDVTNGGVSASASIKPDIASSIWLANNSHEKW